MDYRARFYSPQLGRFIQPDTIIPDQFNPQSWNRYSYVINRPVNLNDPTGHCLGVIICAIETINAALFLSVRMIQNGGLTDSDFGDAANYAVPTIVSASKESLSLSYGVHVAPTVRSISLVTTARGEVQFFHEKTATTNKIPHSGGLPGITLSFTHGGIFNLDKAKDYKGGAVQLNLSLPIFDVGGVTGEAYISTGYTKTHKKVWGIDVGPYIGVGPTIISTAHINAEPIDNTHFQLNGKGLLICRLLSMCGAAQ